MRDADAETLLLEDHDPDVDGRDFVDESADEPHFPKWHDLGDAVALFRDEEIRPALVESAIDALERGVSAEEVFGFLDYLDTDGRHWIMHAGAAERALVEADLREAKRRLTNAQNSAVDATHEDLRRSFTARAESYAAEIDRLNEQLEALHADTGAVPSAPESFDADIDVLLHALARLTNGEQRGTADEVTALHRVLVDRSVVSVASDSAVLRYHMLVPTTSGVMRLGPVEFTVPNRIPPLQPGNEGCPWILAECIMGESRQQLQERPVTAVRRFVRAALEEAGYSSIAAQVLALCPVPEVAVAVARDLGFDDLPAGDATYERWIIGRYRVPKLSWRPMYYVEDPLYGQAVLDHLADLDSASAAALAGLIDCTPQAVRRLALTSARGRSIEPALEWVELRPDVPVRGRTSSEALTLRRRACPHCGEPLSFFCKTPETAVLLCDACRRTPLPDSPTFPQSYWRLRLGRYEVGRVQRSGADPDATPRQEYFEEFWREYNASSGEILTTQGREAATTGVGVKGVYVEIRVYRSKVRVSLQVRSRHRRDLFVDHYLRTPTIADAYGQGLVTDIVSGRNTAMLRDELAVDVSDADERARAIEWLLERRNRLVRVARGHGPPPTSSL